MNATSRPATRERDLQVQCGRRCLTTETEAKAVPAEAKTVSTVSESTVAETETVTVTQTARISSRKD